MTRAISTALVFRGYDNNFILPVSQAAVPFDNTWNKTIVLARMFDAKFVPIDIQIDSATSTSWKGTIPKEVTSNLEVGSYVIRGMADKDGKYYLVGVIKIQVEDN